MLKNKTPFIFIVLALSLSVFSAELQLEVRNITAAGIIHIAVYDSKEVFESDRGDKPGPQPGIINGLVQDVKEGQFSTTFSLPEGKYAVGLYIDTNENKKMDTNFFGIPKEQFGFSNNAKGLFGPPDFESAAFIVDSDMKILIEL
jgi:uncharacterized protein (DUF2141 family)